MGPAGHECSQYRAPSTRIKLPMGSAHCSAAQLVAAQAAQSEAVGNIFNARVTCG